VLDVIEEEGLIAHAAAMERVARERLMVGPVTGILGRGLLLGLATSPPAKELNTFLFGRGILAGTSAEPHVLRLMPPLVTGEPELERLAEALKEFPGGRS